MNVPIPVLAVLAVLSAIAVLRFEIDARRSGTSLFGRVERWRPDCTADATFYVLCLPLLRRRWTHSTALHD